MSGIKEIIIQKSSSIKDEVIRLRRHFHRHPELSYREEKTARFIEDYLKEHGISFRKDIAGNGIIGRIDGRNKAGRVIAVRAEMDALPITELNRSGFASIDPGIMHACGHDAHMAMLLGCARIMKEISDRYDGTVLLIFQPGEEKSPGGALLMIRSGELNGPRPDIFLAQHVLPELETGRIGYKHGNYMASCDEVYVTVRGKGGHAALPGLTTDQIYIASKLVIRLKEGISERVAEYNVPTVFGIGLISGEGATNIIPGKVEIAGTFRTFDEKWRLEAQKYIMSVSEATAKEYGVTIDVRIAEGYPVLQNDTRLSETAVRLSRELLGEEKVEIITENRMSSDDFSFYSALAPSLYYRVGIKRKGAEVKKLHTPEFDIDEDCLETGVTNMSWLILNLLSDS